DDDRPGVPRGVAQRTSSRDLSALRPVRARHDVMSAAGKDLAHEEVVDVRIAVCTAVPEHRYPVAAVGGVVAGRRDHRARGYTGYGDGIDGADAEYEVQVGSGERAGTALQHDDVLILHRQVDLGTGRALVEDVAGVEERVEQGVVARQIGTVHPERDAHEHDEDT